MRVLKAASLKRYTYVFPMRSDLPYIRVVEIYPNSKFGVEEERRIMFAVIRNYADQLMVSVVAVMTVKRSMEHVRQPKMNT